MAGVPVFQPAAQRGRGAQVRVVGAPDRDRLPGPVLVGLRAPDRQHDAPALDELEIAGVEPDDFGASQGAAEAGEQDGAVAQAERRVGWARTMRASIAGVIGVAWRAGRVPLRRRMPSISRAMLG